MRPKSPETQTTPASAFKPIGEFVAQIVARTLAHAKAKAGTHE
jgi:hypothetical protein